MLADAASGDTIHPAVFLKLQFERVRGFPERRLAFPRLPPLVADSVKSAVGAIPNFGLPVVALLPVIPVAENQPAVGRDFYGYCGEILIIGTEEIGEMRGAVSRTLRDDVLLIDAFAVNIAKERAALVFRGKVIALVDRYKVERRSIDQG